MKIDMLIKGGRIIDPTQNIDIIRDIAIKGNKIVDIQGEKEVEAKHTINAEGCVIFPGLIDYHAHLFQDGTELGVYPDTAFLPTGVTTVVDAGSAGVANYDVFSKAIIANSKVRIKSFLNVCPAGLITTSYHENINPKHYSEDKMAALFERYPNELLALKIRFSKELVGELGIEPLRETIRIAEKIGCPVVVHTTNPPIEAREIVGLLRKNDVYCHVYQGKGNTIISGEGKVSGEIKEARERGVIFDAANGKNHFSFYVAEAALKDNFLPDIISTDITTNTMYHAPVMALPYIMSKYLSMGVDLMEVVRACTEVPARMMGMEGKIGTLSSGSFADVAIFKISDEQVEFADFSNKKVMGKKLLIPQMTIRDGVVVFRQMNF